MAKRIGFLVLCLAMLVSLAGAPLVKAEKAGVTSPAQVERPARPLPEKVPVGENGFTRMSVADFIAGHKGQLPRALEKFSNLQVTVLVEMEQAPLAQLYVEAAQQGQSFQLSATSQQDYLASLSGAQSTVASSVEAAGGVVIDRYTKVYNGMLIKVPAGQLAEISKLAGVKAVHRAPRHHLELETSVPLIRAPEVWSGMSYQGEGMTVAIIDSGIDYTHATFGGTGTPEAYEENDPTIIEPGTFPTAKVIGGYDFAGAAYDANDDTSVPVPDEDPLDGDGHGTHVASIAAGAGVPEEPTLVTAGEDAAGVIDYKVGPGVAPAASLYAFKIFGEPAGSTNLALSAIERAVDPNNDGDISDRVDVINMSIGSDFGPADNSDPEMIATNYAAALGVFVAASSGNAADSSYITGSPAASAAAISVAGSTTGYVTGATASVTPTTFLTLTNIIYLPPAFDDDTGHFTETVTAPLFDVSTVTDSILCTTGTLSDTIMEGYVALIQRGNCDFSVKVNNAASLGAVAALVYNHEVGGDQRMTMGGGPVAIPAGFIARTDGLNLLTAHGETVEISSESEVITVPDLYVPADSVYSSTSRGPRGYDSKLKPEIGAPGVEIFAARMGSGDEGISYSGTSMASPHIAGVAALVRQAHSTWTVEQVKAALMNTAVDYSDGSPIPRVGAGRVDAFAAADTDVVAVGDPQYVSLSWGNLLIGSDTYSSTKLVTLYNTGGSDITYNTSWDFYTDSITNGVSLALSDAAVTVTAGDSEQVDVTLTIDPAQIPNELDSLLEEVSGFVVFTNSLDADDVLRVPFYFTPKPYTELAIGDPFTVSGQQQFTVTHTGPITSSLWAYPLVAMDHEEPSVGDAADIRMVGMEVYSDTHATLSINTYGSWHVPQPYFAEFDFYMDMDEDGNFDYVLFNYNMGAIQGGDDTNDWIVAAIDLNTGDLYYGSDFFIYTDYNSGIMEWYIPIHWYVSDLTTNSDFNYQLLGYDYKGNVDDDLPPGSWDMARSPLLWGRENPGPANRVATVAVVIDDFVGYSFSKTMGVMLVDYKGKPGPGQAYAVFPDFGISTVRIPLILQSFAPPEG